MESAPAFLDVPMLLEASEPVRRPAWLWYMTGLFIVVMIVSALAGSQSQQVETLVSFLSALLLVGVMIASSAMMMAMARSQRSEQHQLEAIEELVQLRRWPEAATLLENILSSPMRSGNHRVQALIYLASVLARYHRFADAIGVHEYLLEHVLMEESSAYGLRLGRAMAMLRDDRLFDADRAINELRRSQVAERSGGLALIEIYRDVKTGHPAEAVEMFQQRLDAMRQQLGQRIADAHILVAKAFDLLGRFAEAQRAYENATLLCPLVELQRRYPEVQSLAEKYVPAPVPAEMG